MELPEWDEAVLVAEDRGQMSCAPGLWQAGLSNAWTMLQGGGGTLYDIAGRHNGALTNMDLSVDWDVNAGGPSLDFDEVNDYVDLLDSATGGHQWTTMSQNISILCHCRPSDVSETDGIIMAPAHTIFELRQEGNNTPSPLSFGIDDTHVHCGHRRSGSGQITTGATVLSADQDYTLAATVSPNGTTVYVNGQPDGTGDPPNASGTEVGSNACNAQIGCRSRDGGEKDRQFYGGKIYSLLLFSHATLPASVIADWHADPCAWIKFRRTQLVLKASGLSLNRLSGLFGGKLNAGRLIG